uniref:Uncharacterized protein n=1 Tax=Panagrolaimus davidi TaxID=227884 RepID=A0A914QDK8_9BILA
MGQFLLFVMIVMTAALITTGGPPPGGPPGGPPMASASNSWRVVQPPTTSSYYNPHTATPFTVPQPTFAYASYGYVTSTGSYVYTPMASSGSGAPAPSTNSGPPPPSTKSEPPPPSTIAPFQQTTGSSAAKVPASNTVVSDGSTMTFSSSGETSTTTTTTTSSSSAVTTTQPTDKEAVTSSAPSTESTAWKPSKAPAQLTRRPKSTISRRTLCISHCNISYSNAEAYLATYTELIAILNDCSPADVVNLVSGMTRYSMYNDFLGTLFQQKTFEQFWLTTTSVFISGNCGSRALTNLVHTLPILLIVK